MKRIFAFLTLMALVATLGLTGCDSGGGSSGEGTTSVSTNAPTISTNQ